ncbi:MAG: mechanosensitive ion channel [Kiritimatiellaceae bacterium]|nr:mechanosensitive ion channel [Kiritimatiellaceae bacterium]
METTTVQRAVNDVEQILVNHFDWLNTVQELLTRFGLKLIAAILIWIIGRWAAKIFQSLIEKAMIKAHVDPMLIPFTCNVVYALSIVFVIVAGLGQLGVQTTSIVTVLGAAGLAVGLALQGSLSNFASGVLIIMFRPFKTGDFIEGGGVSGIVHSIHIFTTTLNTPDNKRVIVPNSKMMGDNIINYSAEGTRRLDLTASISYRDSIDTAKVVLLDILNKHPLVLKNPEPVIGVLAMAESSINIAVRPWVKAEDYWMAFFSLNEEIKKGLEAEGLTIPFPQREVHVYNHDAKLGDENL